MESCAERRTEEGLPHFSYLVLLWEVASMVATYVNVTQLKAWCLGLEGLDVSHPLVRSGWIAFKVSSNIMLRSHLRIGTKGRI